MVTRKGIQAIKMLDNIKKIKKNVWPEARSKKKQRNTYKYISIQIKGVLFNSNICDVN